jgi:hypothetical protein
VERPLPVTDRVPRVVSLPLYRSPPADLDRVVSVIAGVRPRQPWPPP